MSGKRSKEHHYIPKAIQRYFCSNGDQLWFSVRERDGKFSEPALRNIKSTFVERDYYTVIENGVLSDRVEKEFYGKIDDFLGKFIKETTAGVSTGRTPSVTAESSKILALVFFHMLKRNPEFRPLHSDKELGRHYFEKLIQAVSQFEHGEVLKGKYELQAQDNLTLLQHGRDIRVRSQLLHSKKIDSELSTLSLRWVISRDRHSFVLPSKSPYRIGNGGPNGLNNPDFEMWLPITPKIAIALLRDRHQRVPPVYWIGRDHMRHINSFGVSSSTSVASHDHALLVSLINSR